MYNQTECEIINEDWQINKLKYVRLIKKKPNLHDRWIQKNNLFTLKNAGDFNIILYYYDYKIIHTE